MGCLVEAERNGSLICQIKAKMIHDMDFRSLLLPREKKVIKALVSKYKLRYKKDPFKDDSLIIYLGDNACRATWSVVSKRVPTFRTGQGKFWLPARNRWLTSKEKLACLGFPVDASSASAMGVPSLPARCTKRASSLAGNSMHLPNVAIMQLLGLCCFNLRVN